MDWQRPQPSRSEIEAMLARLEESQEFRDHPKSLQLVRYLLSSQLLESASLAASELRRQLGIPDDAQRVRSRIHALRRSLQSYYEDQGRSDRWRIEITLKSGRAYQLEFRPGASSARHPARVRQQLGLTQERLAERAGLNIKTVQKLERGGPVSVNSVRAIAAALGVDPAELFQSPLGDQEPTVEGKPEPEPDFEVHFDPAFEPEEIKDILTALADYYRAVGGAGLELSIEEQETTIGEHAHV